MLRYVVMSWEQDGVYSLPDLRSLCVEDQIDVSFYATKSD